MPTINKFVVDDNEICETTAIADYFNSYFANVVTMLAQTYADQDEKLFLKFPSKRSSNFIFLEPTFSAEVFNILHALNPNTLWFKWYSFIFR